MSNMYNLYRPMIGRLNLRQFQKLQARLQDLNESDRFLLLYRQLELEMEADEKESNVGEVDRESESDSE